MSTTVHLCVSVRGMLNWPRTEMKRSLKWITDGEGKRYPSVEALRNALMDELAQGHEVLPTGGPCEGFDFKTGCPGHRNEKEEACRNDHLLERKINGNYSM